MQSQQYFMGADRNSDIQLINLIYFYKIKLNLIGNKQTLESTKPTTLTRPPCPTNLLILSVNRKYDIYMQCDSIGCEVHKQLFFIQIYVNMDLQFIEVQHRQNVLKLMEICGLEMKEAYELYANSNYNFEAAVNRNFNPPPPANQPQQNSYAQFAANQPNMNFFQPPMPLENQFEDDDDYKYSQYKKFMLSGKPFDSKYPPRSNQTFFQRIIPKFFKGEADDPFKAKLEKYIDKPTNLRNTVGNLSQVLSWSCKQKYPALIIILDFSPQRKEDVKRLFSEDMFVEQVLNQQFKLYGCSLQYNLQEYLKPHFNLQRDANTLIVVRVNHLQEIQIMHRIPVTTPYQQLKKKLKMVKSECIQVEMEESNIARQYQQQRRGNFNYRRPRTIKENIKLKEDKKIRKQQEQQFYKAVKKQQQKPVIKEQIKKQVKGQQPPKIKIPEKPQISQQKLRQIRQQKFNALKKYSSGLSFKIRVPSGQNLIISVDGEQLVQYLFDYIGLEPNDLGFNNEANRQFDIFIGFGGSQTLKGKQKEKLNSLFEDSQVLIVREVGE